MSEMVLPGVYIEVRPEGLIVPGQISVNTIGIVGTASRGPVGTPVFLGSIAEARERFGDPDPWRGGTSDELTLVRALQLAYGHGATSVTALRVASGGGAKAGQTLSSAGGECVRIRAATPGTWGNSLQVNVAPNAGDSDENPFVLNEEHPGAATITLKRKPVAKSARNRVEYFVDATGVTHTLAVIYEDTAAAPTAEQAKINTADGTVTFGLATDPQDKVTVSYMVAKTAPNPTPNQPPLPTAVKVTVRQLKGDDVVARAQFTAFDGDDLVAQLTNGLSTLVDAVARANSSEMPTQSPPGTWANFTGGDDGAATSDSDYRSGFEVLLNEDAQIMVAAGQDDSFGDDLDSHCQTASTDAIKRDRIGVVGSGRTASLDTLRGHTLASDRIVFVAPGIRVGDDDLPGSYAAAAVAGLLAAFPPHISLTNKTIRVDRLATRFNSAQLIQLLDARVLALEQRNGFRIVRGITTSTNTAWLQITTRRIVDYAKYGVRSAAEPYIGLLNNARVRSALRTTVNSFLAGMVDDEMLVSYDLTVGATRDEERRGIARVTMVLRPTFSIDFIKVTMFLE
jgi:hypothetical protein